MLEVIGMGIISPWKSIEVPKNGNPPCLNEQIVRWVLQMLNYSALQFLENIEGRALASVLSEGTGISARTLRKPEFSLSPSTIEKADQYSRQRVRQELDDAGYSNKEVEDQLSQHPANEKPGMLYSSIVFQSQVKGIFEYPRTMEFARKIDELSSLLYEARVVDDFSEFKKVLMNSPFADPAYFSRSAEEMGLAHPPMLELFRSAHDWRELAQPFFTVQANTLFSLLAHWDVEFCPQFFPSFAHLSCFAMVLPRIDPRAIKEDGSIAKRRDMLWLPVRRLIGMMACMGEFVRSKSKLWPENVPSVEQIATQAQLAGEPPDDLLISKREDERDNMSTQSFVNWRDGTKKFNKYDFVGLWWQLCPDQNSKYPAAPWPLFAAALFWQQLDVCTAEKWGKIKHIEDRYNAWWHRHYDASMGNNEILDLEPWPDCLMNI